MEYKKEAQQLTDKKTGKGIYPIVRASDLKNDDGTPYVLPAQLKPSGTDTSANILAFEEDKGIYVATDNGHWYYWTDSAYADGGVYQATEIGNKEVDYLKLDDDVREIIDNVKRINLIDNSDITDGYVPSTYNITSKVENANGYMYTKPILVQGHEILYISQTWFNLFFYDINGDYISQISDDTHKATIPSNAVWLKIGRIDKRYKNETMLTLDKMYPNDFTPYDMLEIKDKSWLQFKETIDVLNVLDKSNYQENYLPSTDGLFKRMTYNGGYLFNQIFDVENHTKVYLSRGWNHVYFYNANGTYISGSGDNIKEYDVPENAKYMRIGRADSNFFALAVRFDHPVLDYYVPYRTFNVATHQEKRIKRPFVLLNFDAFALDERWTYLNNYGFKATVASNYSGETNGSDNAKQITKTLLSKGWDIATYKANRPMDSDLYADNPSDDVVAEWDTWVKQGITETNNNGMFMPTAWFCSNMAACDGLAEALKNNGYACARGYYYFGTTQYEKKSPYRFTEDWYFTHNPYYLYGNETGSDSLQSCKAAIDNAIANNEGVAIFTHKLYETAEEANQNFGTTTAIFHEFIDYVKSKVDSGLLDVITYREMYSLYYPEKAQERSMTAIYQTIYNQ